MSKLCKKMNSKQTINFFCKKYFREIRCYIYRQHSLCIHRKEKNGLNLLFCILNKALIVYFYNKIPTLYSFHLIQSNKLQHSGLCNIAMAHCTYQVV